MPEKAPEPDRRLGIDELISPTDEAVLLRLEEEADVRPGGWRGVGFLRAKKRIEAVRTHEPVQRAAEDLDLERLRAEPDDPGGVIHLADGGISIPIYEEEVIVTKRVVLRERIVIRKRVESHLAPVETELRRERIEIEVDESVRDRVTVSDESPAA
jgi:stress response protein YsnF